MWIGNKIIWVSLLEKLTEINNQYKVYLLFIVFLHKPTFEVHEGLQHAYSMFSDVSFINY